MSNASFSLGLEKTKANYSPLTPVSYVVRAAEVHPDRVSIVHGNRRFTWSDTFGRCRRLASALRSRGIDRGDVVAVMAPNVPAAYEVHFAVPMLGAVLNMLNTRLDADAITYMLGHGGAKIVLVDGEFSGVVARAISNLAQKPVVVDIPDDMYPQGSDIGEVSYEQLVAAGDPNFVIPSLEDEWDALSLSYTSGTTGSPKGVVYHHRGAHLNAISNVLAWEMPHHPVYLWTLPMFHCNGWCFPWTIAALAGTNVCLRRVDPAEAWELIRAEDVTHLCGAPIVYSMLTDALGDGNVATAKRIKGLVGGAPPSPTLFDACENAGIDLTHAYGATEVYGPAALCVPQEEWRDLPLGRRAELLSRQGVRYPLLDRMTVVDPETATEVPPDGKTVGEIVFRGNVIMKGYLKDPQATRAAFAGDWFHTGDLAVKYPDNYVKICDRSKDIIISGGENISSVEIEEVLIQHPGVFAVAVVAEPNEKWGEVPCAFIETKPGASVSEAELISLARSRLAGFKVPKRIVFTLLPRTSTGKTQKFALREVARKHPPLATGS